MEPERRKVGGWKSSNHSVTSEGGEEVKRRPTWPLRFYGRQIDVNWEVQG